MPDLAQAGRLFLIAAAIMALTGMLLLLVSRLSVGDHFPGDIRFRIGNASCVFSLSISLLLSIGLTVVLNLLARWLRR